MEILFLNNFNEEQKKKLFHWWIKIKNIFFSAIWVCDMFLQLFLIVFISPRLVSRFKTKSKSSHFLSLTHAIFFIFISLKIDNVLFCQFKIPWQEQKKKTRKTVKHRLFSFLGAFLIGITSYMSIFNRNNFLIGWIF